MNPPDSDEYVACFKKEDVGLFHTGRISDIVFPMRRSEAHQKKVPHIISRIYAVNIHGEYLVQRRSFSKRSHPGLFTDSASGHIRYIENFSYDHIVNEAVREMREEMGVDVLYIRLLDIILEEFRSGGCELSYNFIAVVDDKINPNYEEVHPDSGFKKEEELIELLKRYPREFVKTAHMYWSKIINEGLGKKILKEFERYKEIENISLIDNDNLESSNIIKNLGADEKERYFSRIMESNKLEMGSGGRMGSDGIETHVHSVFDDKGDEIDNKTEFSENTAKDIGTSLNVTESIGMKVEKKKNDYMESTGADGDGISRSVQIKPGSLIGAFIGRFQPFHNGHLKVIQHALIAVGFIKIGIGSAQYYDTPDNPFTFEERREMIVRSLKWAKIPENKYEIYAIEDKHDIHKWVKEVLNSMGKFHILFGNSPWVRQLFIAQDIMIAGYAKYDFKKYNGTYIRKRIVAGEDISDLVPPPVVEYLNEINAKDRLKRIYIEKRKEKSS